MAEENTNKKNKWAGKTKDLTREQIMGGVRGLGGKNPKKITREQAKSAMSTDVDINTTTWKEKKDRGGKGKGGVLVGLDGKRVTGTVTLPGGKKATYVDGKRVAAAPKKPKGGNSNSNLSSRSGNTGGTSGSTNNKSGWGATTPEQQARIDKLNSGSGYYGPPKSADRLEQSVDTGVKNALGIYEPEAPVIPKQEKYKAGFLEQRALFGPWNLGGMGPGTSPEELEDIINSDIENSRNVANINHRANVRQAVLDYNTNGLRPGVDIRNPKLYDIAERNGQPVMWTGSKWSPFTKQDTSQLKVGATRKFEDGSVYRWDGSKWYFIGRQ